MLKKTACKTLWMILVSGSTAWAAQMPASINNARNLKCALRAAKTPEDHQRIAAYCNAKADSLDAQAAEYEKAAETYRNGPAVKNLTAPDTAARYESLAKELREEAKCNRDLAVLHTQVAR